MTRVRIIQSWAERVQASHVAYVNGLTDAMLTAEPTTDLGNPTTAPKSIWHTQWLAGGAHRHTPPTTPDPDDPGTWCLP
jgi:hypothetical protein